MRKSKLETYEDILRTLVDKPLTLDILAYQCNMDCVALRKRLNFLIKNGLIEQKNYKEKAVYALMRRGTAIFKTLNITRRLRKLQTTIIVIDHNLRTLPTISKQTNEEDGQKS